MNELEMVKQFFTNQEWLLLNEKTSAWKLKIET